MEARPRKVYPQKLFLSRILAKSRNIYPPKNLGYTVQNTAKVYMQDYCVEDYSPKIMLQKHQLRYLHDIVVYLMGM